MSGAAGRIDTLDTADGPPLGAFENAAFERRVARLDTPVEVDYYRNGGILQTVLRHLMRP